MSELLPSHPHPQDGELFSNWILDLASGNLVSVKELLQWIGLRRKHLWIEKPDEHVLSALLPATGVNREEISRTLPSYFEAVWNPRVRGLSIQSTRAWLILTAHSLYAGGQYCAECFRIRAYFQLRWRFAFCVSCPIHGCLLRNTCPHCGAPTGDGLQLHLQFLENPQQYLGVCCRCGHQLADVGLEPADQTLLLLTRMHEALAKDARCRGYFSVLRSLLQFMLGPNQPTKLFLRHVVPDFPLVYCHQGLRRFEGLDARTRGMLLGAAVGLLQNWPYRFIELLRELGIRKNWITHDYDLPPWYLNAFKIAAGSSAISEPALGEGVLIAARKEGWIAAINSSDHCLPESRVA